MHGVPIAKKCLADECLIVDLQTAVHVVPIAGKCSDDDRYLAALRSGMRTRCSDQ